MPAGLAGCLVILPAGAFEIAADHAFDRKYFCFFYEHGASAKLFVTANRFRHFIKVSVYQMIMFCGLEFAEPEYRKSCQDMAFPANRGRQDAVKCRETVGCDKQQLILGGSINITHLAPVYKRQVVKIC